LNTAFLFPFVYFYITRLSKGSLAFHALFEWLAAVLLVVCVGRFGVADDLLTEHRGCCGINDLFAARRELNGRKRGPQQASVLWISAWVSTRIASFIAVTTILQQWHQAAWWFFFAALAIVFILHNWLDDREMKTSTFAWLAWFRFMAPVIFVVQDSQRMGIGLAVALGYVVFRQLGYLDSKGLLIMPGRQRRAFRQFFFLMPLVGIFALWTYPESQGYIWLTTYWALVALVGTIFQRLTVSQQG